MPRVLLIGFFTIQVLFDLVHSVTALPFVHYGMFSQSFPAPDSLTVFEVTVNGRLLDPRDFSIHRWDMIQNPLVALDRQTATGDYAFDKEQLRSGLRRIGAGSVYTALAPNLDNTPGLGARFPRWYSSYLSRLTRQSIRTLRVDRASYRYDRAHFILLKKDTWINL